MCVAVATLERTNYLFRFFAGRKLNNPPRDYKPLPRRRAPLTQVPLESGRGGLAGAPYRYEAAPVALQARVHLQRVAALFGSGTRHEVSDREKTTTSSQ